MSKTVESKEDKYIIPVSQVEFLIRLISELVAPQMPLKHAFQALDILRNLEKYKVKKSGKLESVKPKVEDASNGSE